MTIVVNKHSRSRATFCLLLGSLLLTLTAVCGQLANAQSSTAPPPPIIIEVQPEIPNIPPPVRDIPPPVINIPQTPTVPFIPILPTDITQPFESPAGPSVREHANALDGLEVLDESSFPKDDGARDEEGIIVRYKPGSEFSRPSACALHLESGDVLVSIRRPSRMAQITSKLANASFSSDSDVEVRYQDGTLRFINLSGLKQKVMIRVAPGVLSSRARVVSIRPGYELVIGDHRLHRSELRPADGYARRFFKTLENGQMAISEISVESILHASDLIANLQQKDSGAKERRILADMSKMAAVLNQVNGTAGFDAEPKASLEVNSQIKQKN